VTADSPTGASWLRSPEHFGWLAAEAERLLDFAAGAAVAGGFGYLDEFGRPDPARPLELWINARMTYIHCLASMWGRAGAGELADFGIASLAGFHDDRYGGWFSAIAEGTPVEERKDVYPHAFVVLAASAGVAAGRPGARAVLDEALDLVDTVMWSEADGLAMDSFDRQWRTADPYRGANANMHLTEALLTAADVTGDSLWRDRALSMATRLVHGEARGHGWRLPEHYDEHWEPDLDYNADHPRDRFRPYGVTPGHLFEWSRLLVQLSASQPNAPRWLIHDAQHLFATAIGDAWDTKRGGLRYTVGWDGAPGIEQRLHWVLAEAIGAAACLATVDGEPESAAHAASWYERFWEWTIEHLVDLEHGSWHHEVGTDGLPAREIWQGKPDIYHAVQATLLPRLPLGGSLAGLLAGATPLA
jgi:sulfoquinovose isomerase